MPAVVKVDRVGVPEVGQYTDGCPPQVVAGRIVFAQLIPGVERGRMLSLLSSAPSVVCSMLAAEMEVFESPIMPPLPSTGRSMIWAPPQSAAAWSDCGVPAWRESAELADAAPFYRQWQPVRHLPTTATLIPHFVISFGPTVAKTR